MTAPIEIHYWPTPNGHKVTIACEEMGLPYEIKPVNIGRGDQFKPAFLAISPNNRMPAIVDPDGPGGEPIAIFESGAILQYLGRKTGLFYPSDERARVKVDEWVFWQMANFGPNAGQRAHFRSYAPSFILDQRQVAYGVIRYTNEVHRLCGVLNGQLTGRDYIAGEYSIADMITWPWVQGRSSAALDLNEFPALRAWLVRVGAREGVVRAMAKASDFTSAGLQGSSSDSAASRSVLFGQRARTQGRAERLRPIVRRIRLNHIFNEHRFSSRSGPELATQNAVASGSWERRGPCWGLRNWRECAMPLPGPQSSGDELFRLGLLYSTGQGGAPLDFVSAHMLFNLAAMRGSQEAKIYRKELSREMDPADVAEAQRAARQWLAEG